MLRKILIGAALGIMAASASAQTNSATKFDPVQRYWAQFGQPDVRVDAYAALEQNSGYVNLGEHGGHAYEVFFADGRFDILVDGKEWIDDLVTSQDEGYRPTFYGQFDEFGRAFVSGFADVTPEGLLLMQIEVPGSATLRAAVYNSVVVSATKCVCFGTASTKTACTNSGCDTSEDCNGGTSGTAYCRWVYGQIANPVATR